MSRFLGSRPQKKNKYRPEYPLTPKAIPAVRVYVPEKTRAARGGISNRIAAQCPHRGA